MIHFDSKFDTSLSEDEELYEQLVEINKYTDYVTNVRLLIFFCLIDTSYNSHG